MSLPLYIRCVYDMHRTSEFPSVVNDLFRYGFYCRYVLVSNSQQSDICICNKSEREISFFFLLSILLLANRKTDAILATLTETTDK